MSSEQYQRGAAKLREVYAGDVVDLPEGTMAFNDVMLRSLFAEVWDRDLLDVRLFGLDPKQVRAVLQRGDRVEDAAVRAGAFAELEEVRAQALRTQALRAPPRQ